MLDGVLMVLALSITAVLFLNDLTCLQQINMKPINAKDMKTKELKELAIILFTEQLTKKAKQINRKYKGAWIEIYACGKAGRVTDNVEIYEEFTDLAEFIFKK